MSGTTNEETAAQAKAPPSVLGGGRRQWWLASVAAFLLLGMALGWLLWDSGPVPPCCAPSADLLRPPRPAPDAAVLADAGRSLYLLVLEDADGNSLEVGTAWVLDERRLVASAEVATLFAALGADERLVARPSTAVEDEGGLLVAAAVAHPAAVELALRLPVAAASSEAAGLAALVYDLSLLTLENGSRPAPALPLAEPGSLRPSDGLGALAFQRSLVDGVPVFRLAQATGRLIDLGDPLGLPPLSAPIRLRHDVPLGPSAAGGPLLDYQGRVVGLLGGVAFVTEGEAGYPVGGVATASGVIQTLAAGGAEPPAQLRAAWSVCQTALSGEPTAVETCLSALSLASAGEATDRAPALQIERSGVLAAPHAPFTGPVAVEQLTLPAGTHLLVLEGGSTIPPAVQVYLDGEPFMTIPRSGMPLAAASIRLEEEGEVAIALLGEELGADYRLRLLGWPD